MSKSTRLPPKKDVALALLESSSVFIHLDPRSEQVRVPPWFKKQAQLVLNVGLNMPVPIPDLNLDEDAVSCTLSFSRSPYYCFVPWTSVYALVGEDGRGMVWPDDVPPEVAAQLPGGPQKKTGRRAHLRSVTPCDGARAPSDDEARDDEARGEDEPEAPQRRSRKPATAEPAAEKTEEIAAERTARAENEQPKPTEPPAERRPALQLASTSDAEDAGDSPAGEDKPKPRKRELPPYLRVIK